MKQARDVFTIDLFDGPMPSCSFTRAESQARISEYAANDTADRLRWWSSPDRSLMRADRQWSQVYLQICNAVAGGGANLPARSASEDSQIRAATSAPLGIYGENGVTLSKRNECV